MFRELQKGMRGAENARAAERRWPATETLAAQSIPPFAPDAGAEPAYRQRSVHAVLTAAATSSTAMSAMQK